MKNSLRICLLFLAMLVVKDGFSQTITVGNFNAGTYGQGSSITVPIQLGGIFNTNEKFEIYLSDASGNFSPGAKIGEYDGFYTTFVNGVIPNNTPAGTGYKIEVRTTRTGSVKVATTAFSIVSTAGVSVVLTSPTVPQIRANEIFGNCKTRLSGIIEFNLNDIPGSISDIAVKDETTNSAWDYSQGNSFIIEPQFSHYTIHVTTQLNGIIGTKSYFFINNQTLNPFTAEYNGVICLPGNLTYSIPYVGNKSIAMNFPGCTYEINWGDGTAIQLLTFEDIKSRSGEVIHPYTISSCGFEVKTAQRTYFNSIGPSIFTNHPFCDPSAPTITIARVMSRPENKFDISGTYCVGNSLTLFNQSITGQSGSQDVAGCVDNSLKYSWYVYKNAKWNVIVSQVNKSVNPVISFNDPGEYKIRLSASDPNISCQPDDIIKIICIEQTPVPNFTFLQGTTELETIKGCAPLSIIIKDKSNVLNACSTPNYEWTLKNLTTNTIGFSQNGSVFQNGTSASSVAPEFIVNNPGSYSLTLTIKNGCAISGVAITKNFTVVGPPIISNFVYPTSFCDPIAKQITFNSQTYNPNFAPVGDVSYNWTITGGSFDYVGGTTNTSPAPSVSFKSYGTFTIKLEYTNGCSTDTKTQTITFSQPLTANITANTSATDISVCTNTTINLAGNVSGPADYKYVWEKSTNAGGTLTPGPTNLTSPTATYTPVQADDDKQLTFILRVTYPSPAPSTCTPELVRSIKVTYTATNTATAATKKICANTSVGFIPTSTLANSQFIWTVISNGPNTGGFNNQSTYTTNPISDILTNSGNSLETVVYQITPRSPQGCSGTPFNLIVTVVPAISGNSISSDQSICYSQTPNLLGQLGGVTLSGGENNTYVYQWEQQEVGQTTWTTALGTITNAATYQPPSLTKTTSYRRKVYSPDQLTCVNISVPVTITVNPLPVIVYSSVPNICNTATSFNLPFSSSQNNPIKYSISAGTRAMSGFVNLTDVDFTTSPIVVTIPLGVAQGTYDFNIKVKNANGCESVSQTFSLIVKAPPTTANAGPDQAKCQTSTFSLAGNDPGTGGGTGTWTIIGAANGTVITTASNRLTTVTGLQVGKNVVLRWTIANGPCIDSYDEVLLTNEPATTVANAGSALVNCNNGSFTLNANTPAANETGTWTIVGTNYSATLSNINDPKAVVSNLDVGKSITLKWTINNLACSSNANVTITNVIPLATNTISFTSPDPCSGQSITINGTTPTGGDAGAFLAANYSYSWEIKNSSGGWDLISNNTKELISYSVNATFTIRRIVTSNQCSITSNELTINVLPPLTNTINGTQTICYNTIPNTLLNNVSGGGNSAYTYKWQSSTNATTGFTDISGAVSMDYSPAALTTSTYFRRLLSSGTCTDISTTVLVTVNPNPVLTGLSDKNYCANSSVTSIGFASTTNVAFTTYRWTNSNTAIGLTASGNGALPAFTTANNTKEPIEAIITVTPIYTANSVACDGTAATFKITILPNITINTIADEVVCSGSTIPTFTPTNDAVNIPAGANITYRWTITGSGTNLTNGSGSEIPAIVTTNNGTTDLVSTITVIPVYNYNAKACDGNSLNYTITVKPLPVIVYSSVPNICNTATSFNLPFSSSQNNPIKYSISAGTRAMSGFVNLTDVDFTTSPIVVTIPLGVAQGTYDFNIKVKNANGCESVSQTFSLIVKAPPTTANAGPDQAKCQTSTFSLAGNDPGTGGGTGTWTIIGAANGTVITTASNRLTTVTGLQVGKNVVLRWTIANGPCIDSYDEVLLTNEPATTVANAGSALVNCNNGSFTLNANTPAANETGTWTIVGTNYSATLSNINDPKAVVSNLDVGKSITLKWTINNLACSSNANVTITNVIPLATNTISFTSPDPCSGQSITINGTTPTGGDAGAFLAANYSYSWEIKNSSGGWDLISNNTKELISYSVNATFTIRRIVTSNQCSITSNELTINVLPPLTNTINGTQTICYNTIPNTLLNNVSGGGNSAYTYKWQSSTNATTGFTDISGAVSMDYSPAALTTSTYFRRLLSSGTCTDISTTVLVTVNPNPVLTGLSDKNYCANSSVTSIGFASTTNVAFTTYRWTNSNTAIGLTASGNGALPAFTTANNTKEPIEAIITVTPIYTANSVACDGTAATFKITILPNITINTIADEVVCSGSTIPTFTPTNDAVNIPAGANITYRWTITGSGTNLTNGSGSEIPAIVTTNNGTTDLVSTITVIPVYNYNAKACDGNSLNYTVTVKPLPTIPNAGIDKKICTDSYQLEGNIPIVGIGFWTQIAGPVANITNTNLYNTTVTGLQLGAHYEFKWSITNSPCSLSNEDIVGIDVLSTIVNSIKANITTTCIGDAVTFTNDILSGGDVPATLVPNYSYTWESSLDGVNNWQAISGTTNTITINPTVDIYVRRIVSSYNICAVISPSIRIKVNPATPTPNAGVDQILCNLTQTNLAANDPGSYIGTWTDNTVGVSTLVFTDIHAFNTSINGLVAGKVYNLTWTISGLSPCPDKTDVVNITVRPQITAALAGADIVLCDQTTGVNDFVTLAGNAPLGFETGTWSIISQPIGSNAVITNINNPNSKLSTLIPGVYTLRWTINNDANSCTPTSDDVIINVFALPVVGTLSSSVNRVCKGINSGTITLDSYTGSIKQWEYSIDNGVNWIASANTSNSLTINNILQTTWYRIKIVSKGELLNCLKSVYSTIEQITVDPKSVGGTTNGSKTVCKNINSGQITLSGYIGNVSNWETSTDNGTSWTVVSNNSATINYTNLTLTTLYRAKVKSGVCSEEYSTVSTITVLPPVTLATTQNIEECNATSSILTGNVATEGIGTWTAAIGNPTSVVFADLNDPKTIISNLTIGIYQFTWTIDNGACSPSSSTLTLNNYPTIDNKIQSTITTICSGQSAILSDQTHTGGKGTYTYTWQKSLDNVNWGAALAGETNKDLNITLTDTTYLRRTIISGPCTQQSNVILIYVQPAITNNIINAQAEVCISKPINIINGTLPNGADGNFIYQWQSKPNAGVWADIVGANAKDYQPNPLITSTSFRRIVTSSLCNGAQKSSSNEVTIIVRLNAKATFTATKQLACIPFDLATVINSTDYPDQNSNYQWFANGVNIGSGLNFPGYTIVNDGDTVVIKLLAISKYGCENDSLQLSFSTVKNVTASFTKDQVKGCGPLTVNFTNTSTPINGGTYAWDFGNGETSNIKNPAAVTFLPHPLNRDTTYIIKLKAITDCFETTYIDSVLVRPKPVATFSPNITKGCSPLLVRFNNQSKGSPNKYTITFGNGDTLIRNDDLDFDYTFLTTKTDTFTVKMIAQNECGIDSSFYDIVVFPNTITPELVVNGSSTSGCAPLTLNFFNNTEGANSFTWDFDDGTTTTTTTFPDYLSHTFTNPGTYVVKLTGTNGCSTASTTETIVVYPPTSASFTTLASQYCANDSVSFINNSPIGNTFLWNFNDGFTSIEVSPKHAFKTPGNFTVSLTSKSTNIDGTTCSVIVNKVITILPPPIATFSTNANILNCSPFTLKVTATPANATAGVEWYFGDPTSPDNFTQGYTANHTYTKAGLYTITSIAYNQTGCLDSLKQLIRITESPIAEFTPGDSSICGPVASINFKNTTTYGGTDIVGYKWFINNTLVSSLKDLTYNFNTPSTIILPYKYVVKLVVLTTIGCPDTVTHTIQFNPLPKALFTVSKNIDCAPFKLAIQNKSTFADNYRWYLNDSLVSSDFEPSNISLANSNQNFQLKLIASNIYGCKIDSTIQTVSTHPKPNADYSLLDSISCNGILDLKITNKTTGATSYIWNFGDGSLESTQTTPAHIYGAPGIYQLRLIASNGFCTDTSITNIRIAQIVNSAFIADIRTGCKTANITFENLSSNATSYLWDFGDGTFSSSKNPTHTYNYQNSPFNVKLIAYGTFGCNDTTVKTQYINITAPPKADFQILPDSTIKIPDYTFTFSNTSTGSPISYHWDFGDGKTSIVKDPIYTYADTGSYRVRLIVINAQGCPDTLTKVARINGVPGYLFVPNAFEPGSEKQALRTFKLKGSGIAEYSIQIFNKWGALLWESTLLDAEGAPSEAWDGTLNGAEIPQGVYIWNIYAKFINGTVWKGMKYTKGAQITTGSIHLIR